MCNNEILSRIVHDLAEAGVGPIDDARRELLGTFVREIALWSGRIHLIGKSNIRKTLSDLIVDSWILCRFSGEQSRTGSIGKENTVSMPIRVADVGSGAGFPGIVWKIAAPRLDITLFERRGKPLRFLERVVTLMKMDGIRVEGGEAGDARFNRQFDVVVSRAAGRLHLLAPLAARLLRDSGAYLTIKGSGWESEVKTVDATPLRLAATEELPDGRGTMLAFVREEHSGHD